MLTFSHKLKVLPVGDRNFLVAV